MPVTNFHVSEIILVCGLVIIFADAKCVLELGSEENDGYTITFMSPASQIDTTEVRFSPKN